MKPSKLARHFHKTAEQNINNAYNRIESLKESLHFQGFGDRVPEIVVDQTDGRYGILLYWNDILFDMEDIFDAFDDSLQITPKILMNLMYN